MLEHACRFGLEGIVSKRADLPYRLGRGDHWIKSKCLERQEFIILGYVPSTAASRSVGSLALGYHDNQNLVYAGRTGWRRSSCSGILWKGSTWYYAPLVRGAGIGARTTQSTAHREASPKCFTGWPCPPAGTHRMRPLRQKPSRFLSRGALEASQSSCDIQRRGTRRDKGTLYRVRVCVSPFPVHMRASGDILGLVPSCPLCPLLSRFPYVTLPNSYAFPGLETCAPAFIILVPCVPFRHS